jgi:hypothetical protein
VEEGLELRQFQLKFPDGKLDFLHESEDLANNSVNPYNCYAWKLSEKVAPGVSVEVLTSDSSH